MRDSDAAPATYYDLERTTYISPRPFANAYSVANRTFTDANAPAFYAAFREAIASLRAEPAE